MLEIAEHPTATRTRTAPPILWYWPEAPGVRQTARLFPTADESETHRLKSFPDAPVATTCGCEWIARHQISNGRFAGHNERAKPRLLFQRSRARRLPH